MFRRILQRIFSRNRSIHTVFTGICDIANKYGIEVFLDGFDYNTLYLTFSVPSSVTDNDIENFFNDIVDIVDDCKVVITVVDDDY